MSVGQQTASANGLLEPKSGTDKLGHPRARPVERPQDSPQDAPQSRRTLTVVTG